MEYNDGVLKKVHEKASAIYKDEKDVEPNLWKAS
jgi:hypothetical protein